MRRFISYITLCSAMLLGTGIAMTPTVIDMNTDSSYRDGKTLTFRISNRIEDLGKPVEYDPADESLKIDSNDYEPINFIKDQFVSRLDNWGLSSYTINTLGTDTIQVTLRTDKNNANDYQYVEKYLTFSGENFELASSLDDENAPKFDSYKDCLDYSNSRIEYIEQGGVPKFPVVVVPLNEDSKYASSDEVKDQFKQLVNYCSDNNNQETDDDGNSTGTQCLLVVWANRKETDKYDSNDQNVTSRIFAAEATNNDNAIWYDTDDKEDKENPYLQLIPQSEAIANGSYDATKASEAYSAAKYYYNCLHADEYKTGDKLLSVTYLYEEVAEASVENLFSYGWDLKLNMSSKTMIASLVTVVLVAVVLALFQKLFALQIFSIAALTTYTTLATFVAFGSQFNIAALFGLLLVGLLNIAQGINYSNNVKNELYKGRTFKKAHQEGVKKATPFSIDSSIVAIVIGIFVFFFAGDVVAKAGTMLVFGGFFSLVASNLFNRILGWMISTDSEAQSNFVTWLNLKKNNIPDSLKEEKQTYFGDYENKNFTKGNKLSLITTAALVVAGIVGMIAFGTSSKYQLFNAASTTETHTVLSVEVKSDKDSENTNKINQTSDFIEYDVDGNVDTTAETILNLISFEDGKKLSEVTSEVTEASTSKSFYILDDDTSYSYYYFNVELDGCYEGTFVVKGQSQDSLELAFKAAIQEYGVSNDYFVSYVRTLEEAKTIVSAGKVFLGIGLGLVVTAVYLSIRFGLGKGLTSSLLAAAASFISSAIFVLTRIPVNPVIALGSISGALFTLIFAVSLFNKTNDLFKESREKDKETFEYKQSMLLLGTKRCAGDVISTALLIAYPLVAYFAFGLEANHYGTVYLNAILGLALSVTLVLVTLAPSANWLSTQLSKIKIKLPERKKKKLGTLQSNKNSSEPEEAIFIGIND